MALRGLAAEFENAKEHHRFLRQKPIVIVIVRLLIRNAAEYEGEREKCDAANYSDGAAKRVFDGRLPEAKQVKLRPGNARRENAVDHGHDDAEGAADCECSRHTFSEMACGNYQNDP